MTKQEGGIVEKLAQLARVRVPEERTAAFAGEFESILAYIGQLDSLSLSAGSASAAGPVRNVLRPDTDPNEPGSWTARLTAAFPKRQGDALSVKKILSHD